MNTLLPKALTAGELKSLPPLAHILWTDKGSPLKLGHRRDFSSFQALINSGFEFFYVPHDDHTLPAEPLPKESSEQRLTILEDLLNRVAAIKDMSYSAGLGLPEAANRVEREVFAFRTALEEALKCE